ncbi:MAG: rhomboid family intrarane serine protease [Solirubrobacterales bacterium]|nr:rhomboid family intrarane serine protease [Solirubrobacterales bacterium]
MAGTPDLFVVCKSCGSEVSPYITECPYCGQRLRKRAPKIEREDGEARVKESRKLPRPTLGPLRTGEIPGIRGDEAGRPHATILLTVLGIAGYLLLFLVERVSVAVDGPIDGEWWRVATSPFLYENSWAQLAVVTTIAIFGWLVERRHGPVLVVLLFALGGIGGTAAAVALHDGPVVLGGNGAALALLGAWAIPHVLARRRGEDDDEADLLGTAVIAGVVFLLPVVSSFISIVAGVTGALVGVLAGLLLSRLKPR